MLSILNFDYQTIHKVNQFSICHHQELLLELYLKLYRMKSKLKIMIKRKGKIQSIFSPLLFLLCTDDHGIL